MVIAPMTNWLTVGGCLIIKIIYFSFLKEVISQLLNESSIMITSLRKRQNLYPMLKARVNNSFNFNQ